MTENKVPLCRDYYKQLKDLQKEISQNNVNKNSNKNNSKNSTPLIKCKKGTKCNFYHPKKVNKNDTLEFEREVGYCYCGAILRTIINRRVACDEDGLFMVVCSRTYKGKNRCKKLKKI